MFCSDAVACFLGLPTNIGKNGANCKQWVGEVYVHPTVFSSQDSSVPISSVMFCESFLQGDATWMLFAVLFLMYYLKK